MVVSVGASIARPLKQIKIIFLSVVLVQYNIQEKWGNGYERINQRTRRIS
jgi:hypothetical protein